MFFWFKFLIEKNCRQIETENKINKNKKMIERNKIHTKQKKREKKNEKEYKKDVLHMI